MNEWQEKARKRAEEFEALLLAVGAELPGDWELVPWKTDDIPPRWRVLKEIDGHREILAGTYTAGVKERVEWKACGWPTYTDERGHESTKDPSNLWNPKEVRPVCTTAIDRPIPAVAKSIARWFPEYDRIYERCAAIAVEAQAYHDETAVALSQLAQATGNEFKPDNPSKSFFLREIGGDPLWLEFRSIGDCKISLSTADMLAVIDLLYRRHTGKRRGVSYNACPECGCTDIEVAAWITDNTDEVNGTGEEGPRNQAYCPQCEVNGDEGDLGKCHYIVESDERKPVQRDG